MKINSSDIVISNNVINCLTVIDRFNENWPKFKEKINENLNVLKTNAQLKSIGAATRITGAVMTDFEIELFFKNKQDQTIFTKDQQLCLGYKACLLNISKVYKEKRLTETGIKTIHNDLFRYHLNSQTVAQPYRTKRDKNYDDLDFTSNTKQILPLEMRKSIEKLVFWFDSTTDIHFLIKLALFIVHLLAIHPFKEGNEKVSFLLTNYLMQTQTYEFIQYWSLESVIEQHRIKYYRALAQTQASFKTNKIDYKPWLDFFFYAIKTQIKLLKKKEKQLSPMINQTQKMILDYAEKVPFFTINDLVDNLRINQKKISVNLTKLLDLYFIKKEFVGDMILYKKKY